MAQLWARLEMEAAAVWDRRCIASLTRICECRLDRPGVSFSTACGPAVRQAAHRIFSHPTTTVAGLLRGHFAQTAARCGEHAPAAPREPILVVTDTTSFDFTSHAATVGLGPVAAHANRRGLMSHAALALPPEGPPLGLTHLSLWARDPARYGQGRAGNQRALEATELKESHKWIDALWGTEATLPAEVPVVLIGDREADLYDLFNAARRPNTHLLVRSGQVRRVLLTASDQPQSDRYYRTAATPLPDVLAAAPVLGTLEVHLPRGPGRAARRAELELRAVAVWLPPRYLPAGSAAPDTRRPQRVVAVAAVERDPPGGAEAVSWTLLTTLPVTTVAEARQVVQYYTRRWVIEEVHLVLKSGLRAEQLQCDDAETLKNTLALLYVVAWRVICLRDTARASPTAPAARVVTAVEQEVLAAVERRALPTVRDVVRAIAHLGGFPRYPSAGEPGVRTLWAGLQRLEAMVVAWRLAKH